jgi:hypothetical protein
MGDTTKSTRGKDSYTVQIGKEVDLILIYLVFKQICEARLVTESNKEYRIDMDFSYNEGRSVQYRQKISLVFSLKGEDNKGTRSVYNLDVKIKT